LPSPLSEAKEPTMKKTALILLSGWSLTLAAFAFSPHGALAEACPGDKKTPSLSCPGDNSCPGDKKTPSLSCPGDKKKPSEL
jgi:hypothetical protein